MSPAHTCFRTALAQAFRTNNRGIAAPAPAPASASASASVAAFLVPTLSRPSKRTFAAGKRLANSRQPSPHPPSEAIEDDVARRRRLPRPKDWVQPQIPCPRREAQGDVKAWLAVIDPFLPGHLRQEPSSDAEIAVRSFDFAFILNSAQVASVDILSCLGLVEGRWQTLLWMVKKLAEDGLPSLDATVQLEQYANLMWHQGEPRTLKDMTESPLLLQPRLAPQHLNLDLDAATSAPDSIGFQHTTVKRALGQLWRSLAKMITTSAEQAQAGDEDTIMPHVLEVIAYMHHSGLMPDSVYTYHPNQDKHALQQPPTIHMLSSKILTALSDATWKAHEASVSIAKDRANAQYFLGHEIPGSRFKSHVTEVTPELWLELVLWSCLHGGWVQDGVAILEELAIKEGEHRWALISWREIMEKEQQETPAPSKPWSLLPMNEDAFASPQDRARTRKTISSEVVTAFIDGLVNQIRLGVGARGLDPERLVASIKTLKSLLDANNLSLGSASWDSIMARLIESGGFVPEKRPELLLRIFELAPGFGVEVGASNASASTNTEIPYFFEPTTLPLSLLHRAMRAFINNGDIVGAMSTLSLLQRHTDNNKQKSVQQFFSFLRNSPQLRKDEPFTSRLPPVSFPAFDTKLPVPLLARLLDLATETNLFNLGRWLLFSDDLDGPLIGPALYGHRNMAASLVRFGTLAGENDLVLKVIKAAGTWNEKYQQPRMPAEVLITMLCCQLKLRRWESVQGMQRYVEQTSTFRPRPIIVSTFASELLRTSNESAKVKAQAKDSFTGLLFAWENLILETIKDELDCTLSIMSTVDQYWKDYCSRFLAFSSRQVIKLATDDFNRMLGGVLDGYGSAKGVEIVEQWCYKPPKTFEAYRAPGGLPTMPKYRLTKSDEYEEGPEDIELVQDSGASLILQGRVSANRQTIWAIIRKVQEEVVLYQGGGKELSKAARTEVRDTLKWAARFLYYLGFDYEDIIRDLGSLAEFAELEAPAAWKEFDGAHQPD